MGMALTIVCCPVVNAETVVQVTSPMPPPWALMERELLRANTEAIHVYNINPNITQEIEKAYFFSCIMNKS